jgi:hypothetical protein
MNRYILFIYFVLGSIQAVSQTLAPSPGINFTRKETVYISGQTTDAQVLALPVQSKSTTYEYADGLGRPIQTVSKQASPLLNDLVSPFVYDNKGRVSTSYLPYRAVATTGAFRSTATNEQSSFYTTPPVGVTGDARPWTNTIYEDSPLDRVLKATKIGSDFASKFVEGKTLVNDAGVVRKWDIVNGRPNSTTTYPAGSLSIQESIDEELHKTRTYTDWLGRKVLSQVQATATTWFDTYYVYNDYNELLFVLTPTISPTLAPSATHVNRWMFCYEYDEFGRQIGSKKPGAGWVYTIFDKWDRPVLTQDGVQRAKVPAEWTYVKYDVHNRPVLTGIFTSSSSRASLTTAVAASTIRNETRTTANAMGYTITSTYPTTATEGSILSITYYDDYNFLNITNWSPSNSSYAFAAPSGYLPATKEDNVKGLATGSKSKTMGATTATWMYSVSYYDQFYQPIQTVSSHQISGRIRTTTQYAFSGEIEKTINQYSYNAININIQRRFTYDHAGRPLKIYHQINNDEEVMLSHFMYNELGEATDIIHHSRNDGSTYLYKTSNKSTIQGWLDEIYYRFSDGQTLFFEKLDYQKSNMLGNTPKSDGLITSQRWKHFGTAPEELYNYSYNVPKLLTAGTYRSKPASSWDSSGLYNESVGSYSRNGNIEQMSRNGNNAGSAVQIDQLAYTYVDGNLLAEVRDTAPTTTKALGFNQGNPSGTDYFYNENGYLKEDKNKGITSITYNLLDLPNQVNFGTNNIK